MPGAERGAAAVVGRRRRLGRARRDRHLAAPGAARFRRPRSLRRLERPAGPGAPAPQCRRAARAHAGGQAQPSALAAGAGRARASGCLHARARASRAARLSAVAGGTQWPAACGRLHASLRAAATRGRRMVGLGLPLPRPHALLLVRAVHAEPDRHGVRRQGSGGCHARRAAGRPRRRGRRRPLHPHGAAAHRRRHRPVLRLRAGRARRRPQRQSAGRARVVRGRRAVWGRGVGRRGAWRARGSARRDRPPTARGRTRKSAYGRWVDGFHTGFVLEGLARVVRATGDEELQRSLAARASPSTSPSSSAPAASPSTTRSAPGRSTRCRRRRAWRPCRSRSVVPRLARCRASSSGSLGTSCVPTAASPTRCIAAGPTRREFPRWSGAPLMSALAGVTACTRRRAAMSAGPVWIDLGNSPHVLFFRPVIDELHRRGVHRHVTARDFAQTVALCARFGMDAEAIGHHGGSVARRQGGRARRSRVRKLRSFARRTRPWVAVSHNSYSQIRGRALAAHPGDDGHGLRVPAGQPPRLSLRRSGRGARRLPPRPPPGAGRAAGQDLALPRPQGAHRPRRVLARPATT